jgi:hypothetical protein
MINKINGAEIESPRQMVRTGPAQPPFFLKTGFRREAISYFIYFLTNMGWRNTNIFAWTPQDSATFLDEIGLSDLKKSVLQNSSA